MLKSIVPITRTFVELSKDLYFWEYIFAFLPSKQNSLNLVISITQTWNGQVERIAEGRVIEIQY